MSLGTRVLSLGGTCLVHAIPPGRSAFLGAKSGSGARRGACPEVQNNLYWCVRMGCVVLVRARGSHIAPTLGGIWLNFNPSERLLKETKRRECLQADALSK